MNLLKSMIGYTWAILAVLIASTAFLGNGYFSQTLAEATGVTVHPRYSGGEVVSVIDHGYYKTSIHRPVFDALIGKSKEGFVQITWRPAARLPGIIREEFDYSHAGRGDCTVTLDTETGETSLAENNSAVLAPVKSYRLRDGWAVRVRLRRQP